MAGGRKPSDKFFLSGSAQLTRVTGLGSVTAHRAHNAPAVGLADGAVVKDFVGGLFLVSDVPGVHVDAGEAEFVTSHGVVGGNVHARRVSCGSAKRARLTARDAIVVGAGAEDSRLTLTGEGKVVVGGEEPPDAQASWDIDEETFEFEPGDAVPRSHEAVRCVVNAQDGDFYANEARGCAEITARTVAVNVLDGDGNGDGDGEGATVTAHGHLVVRKVLTGVGTVTAKGNAYTGEVRGCGSVSVVGDCIVGDGGIVRTGSLSAGMLLARGAVAASTVRVTGKAVFRGEIDEDASVRMEGAGTVAADCTGELVWEPVDPAFLHIDGTVLGLAVRSRHAP